MRLDKPRDRRIELEADVGARARALQLEYRVKKLPRSEKLAIVDGRLRLADLLDAQVLEEDCA